MKITLSFFDATGVALMRKREDGPDMMVILRCGLDEAAAKAGCRFLVEDRVIFLAPAA